jgi:RNA polymerase sigma factor (sigma-70 family)
MAVDETAEQSVTDLRPLMVSIAYRMVGSFSEAEDLVQEAFLRLHQEDGVANPRAWLTTVTTRLAIDHLRSARVRREQYPGTWLPEPVLADPAPDAAIRAETLSYAVLVLLERLSPLERAVFVLREALDYGYDEIAEIVGKSEANCRQLASRARRHVGERKRRFEPPRDLVRRFVDALYKGETQPLVDLLAADVEFSGDGGGKAPAIGRPMRGAEAVARVLAGFSRVGRR